MPGVLRRYQPSGFDVTVTCSYPFTNWLLRGRGRRKRSAHVFVTENGKRAPSSRRLEYRVFGADGVVCTSPDDFERNRDEWFSTLIANGMDVERFSPGPRNRSSYDLPPDVQIVLMKSALNPNQRAMESIGALGYLDETCLVVAGDSALRDDVDDLAGPLLPGGFRATHIICR